jgi:hypothetical protein
VVDLPAVRVFDASCSLTLGTSMSFVRHSRVVELLEKPSWLPRYCHNQSRGEASLRMYAAILVWWFS